MGEATLHQAAVQNTEIAKKKDGDTLRLSGVINNRQKEIQ